MSSVKRPEPLIDSIVRDLQRDFGGYLYVACLDVDCKYINFVPYGKAVKREVKAFSVLWSTPKLEKLKRLKVYSCDKITGFMVTCSKFEKLSNKVKDKFEIDDPFGMVMQDGITVDDDSFDVLMGGESIFVLKGNESLCLPGNNGTDYLVANKGDLMQDGSVSTHD